MPHADIEEALTIGEFEAGVAACSAGAIPTLSGWVTFLLAGTILLLSALTLRRRSAA